MATLKPLPLSFTVVPTQTPTATTVPQNGHVVYVYDGDGNLVKSVIGDVVTYYPNGSYELKVSGSNEVITKYYSAGSSRIAYRINDTITWLLNDHLGSTVGTVDADGELIGTLKYTAYGELRTESSTTDYRYTGQREESEIGLYFYVARFFDPAVGRFISADTIVPDPGSSQGYDRYGYVSGNPINRNDPSGHMMDDGCIFDGCETTEYEEMQEIQRNKIVESQYSLTACQSGADNSCSNFGLFANHYPKLVTGVSITYSGQAGYAVEGGGLYETNYIMDWKEGNLYITKDAGAFIYGGTPTGLEGELELSFFVMHGIPHDATNITEYLRGSQVFASPELGIDTAIGSSISGIFSMDLNQYGRPKYNLGSGYQYTTGLSLSLTGNEIPNGIEAGVKIGKESNISVRSIPLW